MKATLFALVLTFVTSDAFAIKSCEGTVVPLALEMALASGQGGLSKRTFIDISADYTEIIVTLTTSNNDREAKFKMTMSDYRNCRVSKVEAL